MIWFLFAIGVLWIMFGTLMLFATQVARRYCFDKLKTKDPRMLSPFGVGLSIFLLLSASSSSQVTFIVILGLVSLAKGVFFLFAPRPKVTKIMGWWFEATDKIHKVWGVATIVLGIAILATIVR